MGWGGDDVQVRSKTDLSIHKTKGWGKTDLSIDKTKGWGGVGTGHQEQDRLEHHHHEDHEVCAACAILDLQ